MPTLSKLARNLTVLREGQGLSQSDLSRDVGIAQQTISLYEKGLRLPKIQSLVLLAKRLHCAPFEIDPSITCLYPEELQPFVQAWPKLDKAKQERILDQIKRIIGD